jgi:hypothetical protein
MNYNINTIKKKESFAYWFERIGISDDFSIYEQVFDPTTGKFTRNYLACGPSNIQSITDLKWGEGVDSEAIDFDALKSDFTDFMALRPEAVVGAVIPKETIETTGENAAMYERILAGCVYLHYEDDDDKALNVTGKCLEWLRTTDFFRAPGSIMYHDAEPQGLLKHSLRVVNHALSLMSLKKFSKVLRHEITLVSLVHDYTKIFRYSQTTRNTKTDTGWVQVPWYKYTAPPFPMGHGGTSLALAKKYLPLSEEMELSIFWHMSSWYAAKNEESDPSEANIRFPMVHLLQWADQSSITLCGQEA